MLKGKNIVLVVTGGIAVYKAVELASRLVKSGANVYTVMTANAVEFVNPLTFKTITRNKVTIELFDTSEFIPHISLSDLADLVVVAPATANIIAKAAHGIADDMASTLLLSVDVPKLVVPAMNTKMFDNPITQKNLDILKGAGFTLMEPDCGYLACGDSGRGRFPEITRIFGVISTLLRDKNHPLLNKNILITAGGTIEDIDPVRFITNRSSGKTAFYMAREFYNYGANITVIAGNVDNNIKDDFIKTCLEANVVDVRSADDMFKSVNSHIKKSDILIMAAAVADFTPDTQNSKIKKKDGGLTLHLNNTKDILKNIEKKENLVYIGFAAESDNLEKNAVEKMSAKNLDYIIANSVNGEKNAMGSDKNELLVFKNGSNSEILRIPFGDKSENIKKLCSELSQIIAG